MAWAVAGGAYVDPVEIRVDDEGSRGLFARQQVRAGQLLLRVPRNLVVTHEVMVETEIGGALHSVEGMLHSRYVMHSVWLARERTAPSAAWGPYVDALPASFAYMPTLRPPEELAALAGTRALDLIEQRTEQLRRDLTIVTDLVDEARGLPREVLVWANHAARTRGYKTPDDRRPALVPIADMANHGDSVASFAFTDSGDFEVNATRDLDPGREILGDYGRNPNARWLAGYGFALPDNPDDEVALAFPASSRAVFVGAVADDRFRIATFMAGDASEIVAAARRADELVANAPRAAPGDATWRRTCEIVRAGERAVLAQIIARADELCAACGATG